MLEKIKSSCNYVASNSEFVTIDYPKVDAFIKTVDSTNTNLWLSTKHSN